MSDPLRKTFPQRWDEVPSLVYDPAERLKALDDDGVDGEVLFPNDPVQSMDEVHIAQFAALLRTLSKQHGRQVIIAVHEKPLFDYLALELSPAFQDDRLKGRHNSVASPGRRASVNGAVSTGVVRSKSPARRRRHGDAFCKLST